MSLNRPCLDCGALNYTSATKCYLCGEELTPALPGTPPPLPTPLPLETRGPLTYSLSTLFLIVTLAGVCFGLIAAAPGLGIPVTVLVIPAMIRTLAETRQQQRLGERPRTEDKIGNFFVSLAVMFAVIVAAGVAFFTACSAIGFGLGTLTRFDSPAFGVVVFLALGSGLFAAVFVTVLILRRTWPRRDKNKK
jgi:hypothetical protein